MGKLICDQCFQEYKITSKLIDEKCPKDNCSGNVVDIDDMMVPIFIELNRKGYETAYCCSGHLEDDSFYNTYIAFKRKYTDLESTDDVLIQDSKMYVIYKYINITRMEGRKIKELRDNMNFKQLTEWKESLSDIEKFDIMINNVKYLYEYALNLPDLKHKKDLEFRISIFCNIFIRDNNIITKNRFGKIGVAITDKNLLEFTSNYTKIMQYDTKHNKLYCYNYDRTTRNLITKKFNKDIKLIFRNNNLKFDYLDNTKEND